MIIKPHGGVDSRWTLLDVSIKKTYTGNTQNVIIVFLCVIPSHTMSNNYSYVLNINTIFHPYKDIVNVAKT